MLQIIGSVLEWILGNTFTYIVFACYGELTASISCLYAPSAPDPGAAHNPLD